MRLGKSPIALQLNDVVSALIDATRPIGADCGVIQADSAPEAERIHISESSSLNVVYGGWEAARPGDDPQARGTRVGRNPLRMSRGLKEFFTLLQSSPCAEASQHLCELFRD